MQGKLEAAEAGIRKLIPLYQEDGDTIESVEFQIDLWMRLLRYYKDLKSRDRHTWAQWEAENKVANENAYSMMVRIIPVATLEQATLGDLVGGVSLKSFISNTTS